MSSNFPLLLSATDDIELLKPTAVEEISNGKLSTLELVETLGPYLTDQDESKRAKGTSLLASTLLEINSDLLNEPEVNVLTAFFIDRLKDHFIVVPFALKGLQAVTSMKHLSPNLACEIILALSNNVTNQALHKSSRHTYYFILRNLLQHQSEELQKKPGDFVYAVISAMDSESDPQNLLFLFDFLPHLFSSFEFKHLAEEAFSILECYFPVDFNAKENCPVTREDLAQGLENCFAAYQDFGRFTIPMVLEKLESSLKVAQTDSLKLLIRGLGIWTIETINPHISELWTALKALILPSSDAEIGDLAIKSIYTLIHEYTSSSLSVQQNLTFVQLLNDISASTTKFLNDPTLSLFLPSMKLLAAVSQASVVSCRHVVKNVFPQLSVLLNYKSNDSATLSSLTPILNATIKFDLWSEDDSELKSILNQIPAIVVEKLQNSQSRQGGFDCLNEIIPVLTADIREKIYDLIMKLIPQSSFTNRDSCRTYIINIAKEHPQEVKSFLLEPLSVDDNTNDPKKKIDVLCWCLSVDQLINYSLDQLFKIIETTSFPWEALSCLRDYCVQFADPVVLHCLGVECKLVQKLLNCTSQFSKQYDQKNNELFNDVAVIIQHVVGSLLAEEQQNLISQCMPQFCCLKGGQYHLTTTNVVLLKGLLIPIWPNVEIAEWGIFILSLANFYLPSGNESARLNTSLLVASLVNKYQNSEKLETILEKLFKFMMDNLESDGKTTAMKLYAWITKSLILRGHPSANVWLDKLIELLVDDELHTAAANGFKLILTDFEEISEKQHCTIRLLFRQRLFSKIKQLISLMEKCKDDDKKTAISLAIAFILQSVPRSLIIDQLKEIIRVMITCIENKDPSVRVAVLEVISGLLESGEVVFEDYVETFVPRCLTCSKSDNMNVRIWALECIFHYGKYKEIKILPFRETVLRDLQTCLDDKKRLVRQKAVKARTRWFLVGSTMDS